MNGDREEISYICPLQKFQLSIPLYDDVHSENTQNALKLTVKYNPVKETHFKKYSEVWEG